MKIATLRQEESCGYGFDNMRPYVIFLYKFQNKRGSVLDTAEYTSSFHPGRSKYQLLPSEVAFFLFVQNLCF